MTKRDLIIIAGGKGTRIAKHYPDTPKLLLPIGNTTLLKNIISQIDHQSLYLSLGFKSQDIIDYVNEEQISCKYTVEESPLGAFGGLKEVVTTFSQNLTDEVIVLLGDIFVYDLNLDLNVKTSQLNTVFYSKNDHPHDSDRVVLSNDEMVQTLIPKTEQKPKSFVNKTVTGLYIFKKQDIIDSELNVGDIGLDFAPSLVSLNKLQGRRLTGVMKDVGSINRLEKINSLWDKGFFKKPPSNDIKRPAVFLDLDGTIIENRGSKPFASIGDPEVFDEIIPIILFCNQNLIPTIVVTNQGDLSKGFKTEADLLKDFNKIEQDLSKHSAWVDDFYYCPHHPERGFEGEIKSLKIDCECRKPKTGMFEQATKRWNIDCEKSIMIGDTDRDYSFAKTLRLNHYFDVSENKLFKNELLKNTIISTLKELKR